jgi:hypothetical protein
LAATETAVQIDSTAAPAAAPEKAASADGGSAPKRTLQRGDGSKEGASSTSSSGGGDGRGRTTGSLDLGRLHALPFLRQIVQVDYLAFVAFFSVCLLRFNFFIGERRGW